MKAMLRRLRAHPRLTAFVVVLVLAGAAVGGYFGARSDSAAAAATTSTTTETVSTGTVKQSVSATGTLAPAAEENLNFSVSGQVSTLAVSEGQSVKKGQTLATIDATSLSAAVAQAQATVAGDQARVDDDRTNGATDTQITADQAALTAATNQLSTAKDQLAAATMSAPIDGVVAAVNLTVGQTVSGSSSSNSAGSGAGSGSGATAGGANSTGGSSSASDPQILVISTKSWIVNASVDDTSVGLIKKGDQAQLSVTGSTATVYGTISSIGLVASSSSSTSSGIASYPVVIDVTGSPSGLHDGANVTATLIYKQVSNAVVVPATALHRNSAGGEYVEKLVNEKPVQTTVRVGLSSGGQTQIVSGLSVGDKINVPQLRLGGTGGRNSSGGAGGRAGNFPGAGQGGSGEFPGRFGGAGSRRGGGLGG